MNLFICDYDTIRTQEGALFEERSNKTMKGIFTSQLLPLDNVTSCCLLKSEVTTLCMTCHCANATWLYQSCATLKFYQVQI